MKTRFFDPPLPRLIAHRGYSGYFPENTLPAFQAAVDAGLQYLELDIWLSLDEHLVVHHDRTFERICSDPRTLTASPLAEIKTLDAGWAFSADQGKSFPFRNQGITIPTLEEVLTAFPGIFFTIEIKHDAPSLETILLDTIRRCEKEDSVLIASSIDDVMPRIRRHCKNIPTGCSHSEAAAFFMAIQHGRVQDARLPGDVLHLPMFHNEIQLMSSQLIQAAHALGVEVHVWTINRKEDMETLLTMGVDGITSDYPDLLLKIAKTAK